MIKLLCLLLMIASILIAKIDFKQTEFGDVHTYKVEIKGEVKYPGIYEVDDGMNLHDLLKKAEVLPKADLSVYNLAMPLYPNEVIVIEKEPSNKLISINGASKEELCTLKGIKEKMAMRIIEYREQNNGFKTLEELMEVKGIGETTFAKLKPYIKL